MGVRSEGDGGGFISRVTVRGARGAVHADGPRASHPGQGATRERRRCVYFTFYFYFYFYFRTGNNVTDGVFCVQ